MPEDIDGPDLAEIQTILETIGTAPASGDDRLDLEYGVLTRIQAEVNGLVVGGGEAPGHDQESLRRLLERINDAVDANRDARSRG